MSTYNVKISQATDTETFHDTSLETGARRTNFKQNYFLILPPFLVEVVLKTAEMDPSQLAIIMRDTITEFDEKHKDDTSVSPAILPFLWRAANSKIRALPRIADLDDDELQAWGARMRYQFISTSNSQPPSDQPKPQTSYSS